MLTETIDNYLKQNHIHFQVLNHTPAYTAQEIAQSTHIPGREMAKVVVVKYRDKLGMILTSANYKLDLNKLEKCLGASKVELASEREFKDEFPDCEVGAMPPFGHLYHMDVYVDDRLPAKSRNIAFNGGSHAKMISMPYQEFVDLEHPQVIHCV